MGVNPDKNWSAEYEILPGKEKVVEELLAKDAPAIFLATDLDREGKPLLGTCAKPLAVMKADIAVWCSTKSLARPFKRPSGSG